MILQIGHPPACVAEGRKKMQSALTVMKKNRLWVIRMNDGAPLPACAFSSQCSWMRSVFFFTVNVFEPEGKGTDTLPPGACCNCSCRL